MKVQPRRAHHHRLQAGSSSSFSRLDDFHSTDTVHVLVDPVNSKMASSSKTCPLRRCQRSGASTFNNNKQQQHCQGCCCGNNLSTGYFGAPVSSLARLLRRILLAVGTLQVIGMIPGSSATSARTRPIRATQMTRRTTTRSQIPLPSPPQSFTFVPSQEQQPSLSSQVGSVFRLRGGGGVLSQLRDKKPAQSIASAQSSAQSIASLEEASSKTNHDKEIMVWIRLLFLCYYGSLGALLPYLPVYYDSIGHGGDIIGLLGAVKPATTFLVAPIWGLIADAAHQPFAILQLTFAVSLVGQLAMAYSKDALYIMITVFLTALFHAPVKPATRCYFLLMRHCQYRRGHVTIPDRLAQIECPHNLETTTMRMRPIPCLYHIVHNC